MIFDVTHEAHAHVPVGRTQNADIKESPAVAERIAAEGPGKTRCHHVLGGQPAFLCQPARIVSRDRGGGAPEVVLREVPVQIEAGEAGLHVHDGVIGPEIGVARKHLHPGMKLELVDGFQGHVMPAEMDVSPSQ